MKSRIYRVNEIFYSVQAEGANAGRSAVFVRFSGCNLKCPFCDTDHEPFREMTKDEIEKEANDIAPMSAMVVLTGGEPTVQLTDDEPMFDGRFTAMETNGIIEPPTWVKWVTMSPKTRLPVSRLSMAHELKFLYRPQDKAYLKQVWEWAASSPYIIPCFIQPVADEKGRFDIGPCIDFIKENPGWRLSLQWHKLFGVR